ncbi:hypothetical protein RJT34_31844 [Clitoria ternatea]|uniref:GATA transcription factor n=1 Tax=Clitoria ternatea TaxID=43366 RepID=A0AAN9EWL1_CLITE
MEVVAASKALKPSLRTEFIFPQAICDEVLCFNANNIVVSEDFSVDDLLDFSNGEFQVGKEFHDYEEDEEKDSTTSGSSQPMEDDGNSNSSAGAADSDSVFAGELAVPVDDVADLEWVSHFVDDSLPELSLLYPVRSEQKGAWTEPEPKPGSVQTPFHGFSIPTKQRTSKARKPNSAPTFCFSVLAGPELGRPPAKKQKKRTEAQTGAAQFQRRCSHCQVQKTPQWRTGPLGAKTLCNACGVRFKSGRLFPEYRPASSPTFSGDIHSNSHRKVLEMRRRKEMVEPVTGSDPVQIVPSSGIFV